MSNINQAMQLGYLAGPVEHSIHQLLYADVIECTIGVMHSLSASLRKLASYVEQNKESLTSEQKEHLKGVLLSLTSESIREALHKGELPITNGIIRTKNQILTTLGVEIPESHQEIQASDYPNYHW
jgi:hypothetical protein